jgi:hypothetical protein
MGVTGMSDLYGEIAERRREEWKEKAEEGRVEISDLNTYGYLIDRYEILAAFLNQSLLDYRWGRISGEEYFKGMADAVGYCNSLKTPCPADY